MKNISYLQNSIRNYQWGSRTFIPELMGDSSPCAKPQAELWMGAHPKGPSGILFDQNIIPLPEIIEKDPNGILGAAVARTFDNNLPFLFKVLAAAEPLSIQAHPDKTQAEKGFAKEHAKKISIDAPDRNYMDRNHKPELICALEPMWVLAGFREPEKILNLFKAAGLSPDHIGLKKFPEHSEGQFIKDIFHALMTLEKDRQVSAVKTAVKHLDKTGSSEPAFKWMARLYRKYPEDIGVLSPLFLNLLDLQPGQAIYISPGELHAYLQGSGLEIMANSDNVLRGGLTPKHIDLKELMKIMNFSPGVPEILTPRKTSQFESVYPVKADEFILSVISTDDRGTYYSPLNRNVEIMICTMGNARIRETGNGVELALKKGVSVIVPASVEQYVLEGEAVVYKASVPV
jgi:mannose-6-phosphate isomerase